MKTKLITITFEVGSDIDVGVFTEAVTTTLLEGAENDFVNDAEIAIMDINLKE